MAIHDLALRRGANWLTLSAVLVGVLNYAYSMVLTWLLPTHAYSMFAGGQALLVVCGTIASASVPWLVAQGIACSPYDQRARQELISFASLFALAQGLLAGAVAALVARRFTSALTGSVVAGSAVAIFSATVYMGYLQGFGRFPVIAGLRVAESAVKLGVGLLLTVAGAGAAGALTGFGLGAFVVAAAGFLQMGRDLRLRVGSLARRELWDRAAWLTGMQIGMAFLANADVLLASVVLGPGEDLARFQVAFILGRAPVFLAIALSTAIFPVLSTPEAPASPILRAMVDRYLRTVAPVSVVVATTPQSIIDAALPPEYAGVTALLPLTAAGGIFVGAAYLLITALQARHRFRAASCLLATGLVVHAGAVLTGLRVDGGSGAALGGLVGIACAVALLARQAAGTWPGALRARSAILPVGLASLLTALHRHTIVWSILAATILLAVVWMMARGHRPEAEATARLKPSRQSEPKRPLRILHLAFEDHRRPGSGGGSVRTHEVNRRLANRHQITVVTTKYKGSRERFEDGVRYIQVGVNAGYIGSIVSYFAVLPLVLWRHPSDLVVEDFAAPISTAAVPLLTRRPVIGMVQWLNAREKSTQYKLPFFLFEELGIRAHRQLIAVSSDLARQLKSRNPSALVEVIPNGVEHSAAETTSLRTGDAVFLGRLDMEHKGLDLLLRAFVCVARATTANLLIAGDGRDLGAVRRLRDDLGLGDRVRLLGRVEAAAKADLLASAQVVCMPSRYETFGMVAAEALAAGTPVLAFDIACLRELLSLTCAVRVPPFDVEAYGQALLDLLRAPDRCRKLGEAGRRQVARLNWETIALRQEHVYLKAVTDVAEEEAAR